MSAGADFIQTIREGIAEGERIAAGWTPEERRGIEEERERQRFDLAERLLTSGDDELRAVALRFLFLGGTGRRVA